VAELAPLFPQLEIVELLGRGGMGAVYKARQPALDRVVALKVLPVTPGADPAFAERFQREARALASLNHPHIVNVYDFGQTPTLSWFLMEYVDGVNLRQLERTSRLSPREALAIVPQVCEALQFAHDRGIVHRDIKPENILVDKQGRVKIADFGLAKLLRAEPGGIALTESRHTVGTPQYMAPEQVEKPQSVDHRADIYSLGVVFYEMLTGELPLGRFPAPSQRVQVDVRLDEIVLKALEKEPERRYQQASAFKTNVETMAGGAAAPVPPPVAVPPVMPVPPAGPVGQPAKQKKSRWWLWLLVGVFLLLTLPVAFMGVVFFARVFSSERPVPVRMSPVPTAVPLTLNLEMRNATTEIRAQLKPESQGWGLPAGQHKIITTIGEPSSYEYRVDGTISPDRDGGWNLDLTVRTLCYGRKAIENPKSFRFYGNQMSFDEPYRIGKLQEDEFRVTLTRAGEPATSPVTKLAVVMAGVVGLGVLWLVVQKKWWWLGVILTLLILLGIWLLL